MRDWRGVTYSAVEDARARDALATIDEFLHQLGPAIGLLGSGQQPNSSGRPAVPLDEYLYLPGRAGGQIAHGGTEAGGALTLVSTKSGTRGGIYLGAAHNSVYDEANDRLGLGVNAPGAALHVLATPIVTVGDYSLTSVAEWFPSGDFPWGDASGDGVPAVLDITDDSDITSISCSITSGTPTYYITLNCGVIPSSATHALTLRCIRGAGATSGTFTITITDSAGVSYTQSESISAWTSGSAPFQTPHVRNYTPTAGGTPGAVNTITLALTGQSGTNSVLYFHKLSGTYTASGVASDAIEIIERAGSASLPYTIWRDENAVTVASITSTGAGRFQNVILEDPGVGVGTVSLIAPTGVASYSLTFPPNDGNNLDLLQSNGSGVLAWASGASIVDIARTWTSLQKFPDDKFQILGSANPTTTLAFELDEAYPGATFTLRAQGDSGDDELPIDLYLPFYSGTLALTSQLLGPTFADNSFRISGSVTPSKLLAFEVDGLTAATTRTLTPQDANYILAGTNITNTFAANQNFAGFKAIALACDNGTAFPTSPAPTEGQWFLYEPGSRRVLYQRVNSLWVPIFQFGASTMTVATTGNDTTGTGEAAAPYLTVQKAYDNIPTNYGGNVIINVGSGTFTGAVTAQGKYPTGAFTITLQGYTVNPNTVPSLTSFTAGGGSVRPTLVGSGWTVDAYKHMLLRIVAASGSQYRWVESNTATVIKLAGAPLTGSGVPTANIMPVGSLGWATPTSDSTTLSGLFTIAPGQDNVLVNDIAFSNTSVTFTSGGSAIICTRCAFSSTSNGWYTVLVNTSNMGLTTLLSCRVLSSGTGSAHGVLAASSSQVSVSGCLIRHTVGPASTNRGVYCLSGSLAFVTGYTVIRGFTRGTESSGPSTISFSGIAEVVSCTFGAIGFEGGTYSNLDELIDGGSNTLLIQGYISERVAAGAAPLTHSLFKTITNGDLPATTLLASPSAAGFWMINITIRVTTVLNADETITLAWVGDNGATSIVLPLAAEDGSEAALARTISVASGSMTLTGSGGVTSGVFIVRGKAMPL